MAVHSVARQFSDDSTDLVGIQARWKNAECLGTGFDFESANFAHVAQNCLVLRCSVKNHLIPFSGVFVCVSVYYKRKNQLCQ
jgi:hypothetical protein